MIKLIFFLMLLIVPSVCLASETDCVNLDSSAQKEMGFHPPLSALVNSKGRVYFHSAPSPQCKNKKVFVIQGDSLTIYNRHKNWLYVMFINKDGDDFEGWVPENKLRIIGKYAP